MKISDLARFVGRNLNSLMKNASDKKYYDQSIEDFNKIKDAVSGFLLNYKNSEIVRQYELINDREEWKQMLETFEKFLDVVSNLEEEFPKYRSYFEKGFPGEMRKALLNTVIIKNVLRPVGITKNENEINAVTIQRLGKTAKNDEEIDYEQYIDYLKNYEMICSVLDNNVQHIGNEEDNAKLDKEINEFFKKSDKTGFWFITDYIVRHRQQYNKSSKDKINRIIKNYKDHIQCKDNQTKTR